MGPFLWYEPLLSSGNTDRLICQRFAECYQTGNKQDKFFYLSVYPPSVCPLPLEFFVCLQPTIPFSFSLRTVFFLIVGEGAIKLRIKDCGVGAVEMLSEIVY